MRKPSRGRLRTSLQVRVAVSALQNHLPCIRLATGPVQGRAEKEEQELCPAAMVFWGLSGDVPFFMAQSANSIPASCALTRWVRQVSPALGFLSLTYHYVSSGRALLSIPSIHVPYEL